MFAFVSNTCTETPHNVILLCVFGIPTPAEGASISGIVNMAAEKAEYRDYGFVPLALQFLKR